MAIDKRFLDQVSSLFSPVMGTELISHLLYSLIRSVKPRRVIEVGLGYTTPFLLQALADNIEDHIEQTKILSSGDSGNPESKVLVPEFFEKPYEPLLIGIDDLSHASTTAHGVLETVSALGLDKLMRLYEGDFRGMSKELAKEHGQIDFIWFDCGGLPEYMDFLGEYMNLVNSNGGIIVLHSTLTNMALSRVIANLKLRQATDSFNKYELLSLLEPHKLSQNSLTMIRMTAGLRTPIYSIHP